MAARKGTQMPARERGPGRPRRNLVDVARSIAWFYAVANAAPRLSIRQLDARFGSGFSRYRAGTTSPTPERVAHVEAALTGTQRYFDSPLWLYLQPSSLGLVAPYPAFAWLAEPLRYHFIDKRNRAALFWRRSTVLATDLAKLLRIADEGEHTMDAATALLGLIHESVMFQNAERLRLCCKAWDGVCDLLHYDALLGNVPSEPFDDFGTRISAVSGVSRPRSKLDNLSQYLRRSARPE